MPHQIVIRNTGFGSRQLDGTESALAKAALWRGQTLSGAMLGDLTAALDALTAHPAVDPARIGTHEAKQRRERRRLA